MTSCIATVNRLGSSTFYITSGDGVAYESRSPEDPGYNDLFAKMDGLDKCQFHATYDEYGSFTIGGKGLVMHETGDEVFKGEFTGTINITKLKQWLKKNHEAKLCGMTIPNVQDLLKHHEFDKSAKQRIESLLTSLEAVQEPLIVTDANDGGVFIIDGWHRLQIFYEVTMYKKLDIVKFMAYYISREQCKAFASPDVGVVLRDFAGKRL